MTHLIDINNLGNSANPDFQSDIVGTSYTNSSWTPPNHGLIIVFAMAYRTIGSATLNPTMTGNSITWSKYDVSRVFSEYDSSVGFHIFLGDAHGSTTGANTIDFGGNSQDRCTALFAHALGVDLSQGVTNAISNISLGHAGSGTGLVEFSAPVNKHNAQIVYFFYSSIVAMTPKAGWDELDEVSAVGGETHQTQTRQHGEDYDITGAATWGTPDSPWFGIGIEIKAGPFDHAPARSGRIRGG